MTRRAGRRRPRRRRSSPSRATSGRSRSARSSGRRASTTGSTRLGFGSLTGVDLPGEEQGIVPKPSQYSGVSMGNLPIGQGESVTPLQLTAAYAAIANGGILPKPHIVASSRWQADHDSRPAAGSSIRASRPSCAPCSRASSRPAGRRVRSSIPGYQLAGKTGTANEVVAGSSHLLDHGLRRVVRRLRARRRPEAPRLGRGLRPAGRNQRGPGRGAGVRPDHVVRPAVPEDPARAA